MSAFRSGSRIRGLVARVSALRTRASWARLHSASPPQCNASLLCAVPLRPRTKPPVRVVNSSTLRHVPRGPSVPTGGWRTRGGHQPHALVQVGVWQHPHPGGHTLAALWHSFGIGSAQSTNRRTASHLQHRTAPHNVCLTHTMPPNPSIEGTHSGLRPPCAPHVKR